MKPLSSFILFLFFAVSSVAQQYAITVHLDSSVKTPLKGRLYVFSTKDTARGVQDPDPFNPTPTFVLDVSKWAGGEKRIIDTNAKSFPVQLHKVAPGYYKFAAVFDIDTTERNNTTTAGNYYSRDVLVQVKRGESLNIHLYLNRIIPQRPFRETEQVKFLQLKSELVSGFRKMDSYIKAAVVLPKSYQQNSSVNYPVIFIIPGWGGTHYDVHNPSVSKRYGFTLGKEKIFVYLNPETNNPFGLHAFIDSRVNGPWGKALVEELVPLLKKQYRISNQLFVAGQSSGGYAALWLQLHYPKTFSGCWAVSPDPVDFSDFTGVNLYDKNANMYYEADGKMRGMFLMNGQYLSTVKQYATFEDFLGDGGQMQSFEAAFGVMNKNSKKPAELFNRKTGAIYAHVVKTWKPYDLGYYLQSNYKKHLQQYSSRIYVFAGAEDNFLLNRSVEAFKKRANQLSPAITVELVPGANHWSIWSESFTQRMHREFDAKIE